MSFPNLFEIYQIYVTANLILTVNSEKNYPSIFRYDNYQIYSVHFIFIVTIFEKLSTALLINNGKTSSLT